jgi:predicted flavoprotein YhiN
MGVTSLKRISRAREDVALIDIFNLVGRKKIVKGGCKGNETLSGSLSSLATKNPH